MLLCVERRSTHAIGFDYSRGQQNDLFDLVETPVTAVCDVMLPTRCHLELCFGSLTSLLNTKCVI